MPPSHARSLARSVRFHGFTITALARHAARQHLAGREPRGRRHPRQHAHHEAHVGDVVHQVEHAGQEAEAQPAQDGVGEPQPHIADHLFYH